MTSYMKIVDPSLTDNYDVIKLRAMQEIANLNHPADCLMATLLLAARIKKTNDNPKLTQVLSELS